MQTRHVFVIAGVVAALAAGVYVAFAVRTKYDAVLPRDLAGPMTLERAEAARIGMRPLRHAVEPVRNNRWQTDFVVEEEQCVALIVGVTGVSGIDALDLRDRGGVVLAKAAHVRRRHVAQVQWCARARTPVRAVLVRRVSPEIAAPEVHWELAAGARGPGLDERTLTRNALAADATREALDRHDEAVAVADLEAHARAIEEQLVPDALERSAPLRLSDRAAVLLPPARTTSLAVQRALMTRDARPVIAPYFAPVPAWLTTPTMLPEASGAESASLLRVTDAWERVLAAADYGSLGPACVAITFARIDAPMPDSGVVRVAIPSLARTPLVERDGVWSDRLCPAEGLYLYTIPATAAALYDVRLHAIPGVRRAHARSRRPTWDGELLPSEERATLEQNCRAAGSAPSQLACLSLARALERDGAAPTDVDRAFGRACTAGSADACGQLSMRLLESSAPGHRERGIALERTACDAGDWVSCEHWATRLRTATDPLPGLVEARRLYGLACTEGRLGAACANLREMERLQLGAP